MISGNVLEVQDISRCLEIGRGSFGKVVSLHLGVDSQLYTVKKVSSGEDSAQVCASPFPMPVLKFSTSEHGNSALQREIHMHHRVNLAHQGNRSNLIDGMPVCATNSVFDAMDDEDGWNASQSVSNRVTTHDLKFNAILMNRMQSNLHRYLKWKTECGSDDAHAEAMYLINQVKNGLRQLHAMNIIHADLSTGNVLIGQGSGCSLEVKISDFGGCRFVGSDLKEFAPSDYVLYLHPSQFTLDDEEEGKGEEVGNKRCSGLRHRKGHSRASGVQKQLTSCPKASPSYDFWSCSILAFDVLMQFCRRQDKRIERWWRNNQGLEVYKIVTDDFSQILQRVAYVCKAFSMQHCSKAKMSYADQLRIERNWLGIIQSDGLLPPKSPRAVAGCVC